jgi:hypothetical protein
MDVIIGRTRRERIIFCDLPSISCSTRESLFGLVEADCPKSSRPVAKSRCEDAHTFLSGVYQELLRVIWSRSCTPTAQECG